MNEMTGNAVSMDWEHFDPLQPQTLRHRLAGHPLLKTESLVELGKRCRGTTRWASFNNNARAGENFDTVSELFPSERSAVDSIRAINDAKAWVLLRHVQVDTTYQPLVDLALDAIQPWTNIKDPGMYYRAGWIFIASPHTVTPFHIDRDNGILLQISGTKRVYVWDPDDVDVVSDRARDYFHTRHDLSLVRWQESFRQRAHVYDVGPGMGVYIPQTSPHMVETSDEPSITISLTYSTDSTRRNAMRHVLKDVLYRLGMRPPTVGKNPAFDRLAYAGASVLVAAHGPGSRAPACPSLSHHTTYAIAD
jgi:hypothetical protein